LLDEYLLIDGRTIYPAAVLGGLGWYVRAPIGAHRPIGSASLYGMLSHEYIANQVIVTSDHRL